MSTPKSIDFAYGAHMTDSQELSIFENQELSAEQQLVLGRLAVGTSIPEACKAAGVTRYQYAKWMANQPAFAQSTLSARAIVADHHLDELDELMRTEPDVQRLKVVTDYRRWKASKLIKQYSDRIDVNIVERVDLKGALDEALARRLRLRCDPVEGDFTQVTDSQNVSPSSQVDTQSTEPAKTPELPDIFS